MADRAGNFVVQLIVSDGTLFSTADTVLVSTNNTPPVANAGPDQTVDPGVIVQLDGTGSSDANNDPLSFSWSLTTRPAGSAAAIANGLTPTPTFTADRPGLYTAQLVVNDGSVDSPPDTVNITARNRDPNAVDDSATTQTGVAITISVLGNDNDPDGDTLSISAITQPANGAVVIQGTSVRYTPNAGFVGTNTFTYTASDGNGGSDVATVTVNVTALPVVTIVATDANAAEEALNTGTFTVSRTGATTAALTVSYAIAGSATNTTDYQTLSGSVVIPASQSSATITVTPVDDQTGEDPRQSSSRCRPTRRTRLAARAPRRSRSQTMTCPASPSSRVMQMHPKSALTTEPGRSRVQVTCRHRSTSSSRSAGQRRAVPTFTSVGSVVNFPANQTTVVLTLPVRQDNVVEPSETVVLTLDASPGYTVGTPSSGTITIADSPAVVTVTASDPNGSEVGPDNAAFTFSRTGGDLTTALAVFHTLSGTAVGSNDFVGFNPPAFIPANQTSVVVPVNVLRDNVVEGNETVVLTISAQPAYSIGTPGNATVTIADSPRSLP